MKLIHLVAVAIRLFSICLALNALSTFIYAWSYVQLEQSGSWFSFSLAFSMFAIALLLWFFPMTAARKLTGHQDVEQEDTLNVSASEIADVLFISLGLYFAYEAISGYTYWVTVIHFIGNEQMGELGPDQKVSIVLVVVKTVAALLLIFGHRAIYRFIRRLRYGG